MEYVGLPELGPPPDGRDAARDQRLSDLERIYDAQLDTPEALVAAEKLKALATEKRSALPRLNFVTELCFIKRYYKVIQ